MENSNDNPIKISTKQKIMNNAVSLFAIQGYTETTIRELAAACGIKEASIYNYFPSKNAILETILEEFAQVSREAYYQDKLPMLKENPTADNILSCISLVFPEGKEEYYLKELYVILQEQHRNLVVRKFLTEEIILSTEKVYVSIIDKLKEFNIVRPDANPDFWIKIHSSLIYTFASRLLLGIGDSDPGFTGKNLSELVHDMCSIMLEKCGAENSKNLKEEAPT